MNASPDRPPPAGPGSGKGQPGFKPAALFASCPRCGAPTLFSGPVQFAAKCRMCGLDYTQFNVGDGPAAFLTFFVGAIVVVLALVVDAAFEPPIWVHALLWLPVTAALVVGGLRAGKALLLRSEYRRSAGEGKLKE